MFERKTVFILGAGASWHYSYPTGEGLVKAVLDYASTVIEAIKGDSCNRVSRDSDVSYLLDRNITSQKLLEEVEQLHAKLSQINPPVIDYFLAQNPALQPIGKMMIAWVILECERQNLSGTSKNNNRNRFDLEWRIKGGKQSSHDFDDDWYRFLIYRLAAGCKASTDLLNNKVHFVTFNYDVSLDHRLYDGLSSIEMFDESDVLNFLNQDRVLHVYGSVRKNPFVRDFEKLPESDSSRSNSRLGQMSNVLNMAYEASKGIRTIEDRNGLAAMSGGNKDEDQAVLDKAKKLIAEAEDVYILGYGFDENNNKRLGLYDGLGFDKESRVKKRIHFTNFGDKQVINKRASKVFFGNAQRFHPKDDFVINMPVLASGDNIIAVYEKSISDVYGAIQNDFDFL